MRRKTATVLALGDYRTRHHTLYFSRSELNQLLGLYSRHVIRGEWRDYAIDHGNGMARFSVFRHTHEAPAFTILRLRRRRRVRPSSSCRADGNGCAAPEVSPMRWNFFASASVSLMLPRDRRRVASRF